MTTTLHSKLRRALATLTLATLPLVGVAGPAHAAPSPALADLAPLATGASTLVFDSQRSAQALVAGQVRHVPVPTAGKRLDAALVRISLLEAAGPVSVALPAQTATSLVAGVTSGGDIPVLTSSGQPTSVITLARLSPDGSLAVQASRDASIRVELLTDVALDPSAEVGNTRVASTSAPSASSFRAGSSVAAAAPVLRLDTTSGLGLPALTPAPQPLPVVGLGGVPADVESVYVSVQGTARTPGTVRVGSTVFPVSGPFATTTLAPVVDGSVLLSADSFVDATLEVRGWVSGGPRTLADGAFVPLIASAASVVTSPAGARVDLSAFPGVPSHGASALVLSSTSTAGPTDVVEFGSSAPGFARGLVTGDPTTSLVVAPVVDGVVELRSRRADVALELMAVGYVVGSADAASDSDDPSLTVDTTRPADLNEDPFITLRGEVTDPGSGVREVLVRAPDGELAARARVTPQGTWSAEVSSPVAGSVVFDVTASDLAGNTTDAPALVNITGLDPDATVVNPEVALPTQSEADAVIAATPVGDSNADGLVETAVLAPEPLGAVGDVVVLPAAPATPGGLLGRVVGVQTSPAGVTTVVEQASLTDVFVQAELDFSAPVELVEDTAGTTSVRSAPAADGSVGVGFERTVALRYLPKQGGWKIDDSADPEDPNAPPEPPASAGVAGTVELKIQASINVTLEVDVDMDWDPSEVEVSITTFSFTLSATAEASAAIAVTGAAEFEKELRKFHFQGAVITFAAGPVPVVITVDPEVVVDLSAKVEGSFDLVKVEESHKAKLGVAYSGSTQKWSGIHAVTSKGETAIKPSSLQDLAERVSVSGEVKVSVTPSISTKLYGAAGPEVEAAFSVGPELTWPGKVPFGADEDDQSADPTKIDWALTATVEASAGVELSIPVIDRRLAGASFKLLSLKTDLGKGQVDFNGSGPSLRSVEDDFERTTHGPLAGTGSTTAPWKVLTGTWITQPRTGAGDSAFPGSTEATMTGFGPEPGSGLAVVDLGSVHQQVEVGTFARSGAVPAFWVKDKDNFWLAVTNQGSDGSMSVGVARVVNGAFTYSTSVSVPTAGALPNAARVVADFEEGTVTVFQKYTAADGMDEWRSATPPVVLKVDRSSVGTQVGFQTPGPTASVRYFKARDLG